jgi:glycosyltransferase involved in cell wall biosynthesis
LLVRILTQHFYPDTVSTGNLLTELAIGFSKNGFDIEVFTSQPLFDIKMKCNKYEEYKGLKIFRLSSARFSKNSKFGKVFNYFNYFFKTFFKILFTSNKKKCVYLIVSNPPFLPVIGAVMNYLRKIKFIHLLYDIHPDSAVNTGYLKASNFVVKIWNFINRSIYKKSAHIIVLSEQMKTVVENKLRNLGVKNSGLNKISIIDNWADSEYLKPVKFEDNPFIKENNFSGKFIVNYSGNIGVAQKFESIMEAAVRLKEIDIDILFLFIGDGVKKKSMEKQKEEKSLSNLIFMEYQPKDILPYALTAANLSVVHLEKEVEGLAMPSKLYTILACGTPVLAFCDENSDLGRIIKKSECGMIVNHNDVDGIVNSIIKMKNNPDFQEEFSKNSRKYFEDYYTFEHSLKKYIDVFNLFKN